MTPGGADPGERIVVVGAGLAGCLLATLLGRRGMQVTVYERRPDPREAGAETGRSINLALSARGLHALDLVGLRERALADALPMPGRMVHPRVGAPNFQPYSGAGDLAIHSISRSGLNAALLEVAEGTPGVRVVFGHRLDSVDVGTGLLQLSADGIEVTDMATVVLACDGAFSAARDAIETSADITISQEFLSHGYKELTIPARDGDFALDPGALHIWARGSSMMIALPNQDRSFTCTVFWPTEGPGGFDRLGTDDEVLAHFRDEYADVVELMPTLTRDYRSNPVGSLVTVRCWPWVLAGAGARVALVGDAAHAIVPFFGQGANCAFEDTVEIDRLLDVHGGDWGRALADYQVARKPNTDAIAVMALENFAEMSRKVNSRAFRARSALTHGLERGLGPAYRSRYSLVSFSTMPYSRINARVRAQNVAVLTAAAGAVAALVTAVRHRTGR